MSLWVRLHRRFDAVLPLCEPEIHTLKECICLHGFASQSFAQLLLGPSPYTDWLREVYFIFTGSHICSYLTFPCTGGLFSSPFGVCSMYVVCIFSNITVSSLKCYVSIGVDISPISIKVNWARPVIHSNGLKFGDLLVMFPGISTFKLFFDEFCQF